MDRWDQLWIGADLATMADSADPFGVVRDGALATKDDRIAWVGAAAELPGLPDTLAAGVTHLRSCWITPGLIDCHTHLVFGGHRAAEFMERLQGETYESIARRGGGILSTVAATRAASRQSLTASAAARLDRLAEEGLTTVEIKSGYGLDTDTEPKMLRAAGDLAGHFPGTIVRTFLGAHAIPGEYAGRADDYIRLVCDEMLPRVVEEGLADTVDAFCERIAFTPEQTSTVLEAARRRGLPVKLHADQLSDGGGAALGARLGALSADHLEHASDEGIASMAEAGTTAVLLPGAGYFTHSAKRPPVEQFRSHGVPMAISTDCNPGSSPVTSVLLMLNMACTLFRLTPAEALAGVTRHAASALGLGDRGTLEVGRRADMAFWNITEPAELSYWMGTNPCVGVVCAGRPIRGSV